MGREGYSKTEAAQALGVSVDTIDRLRASGELHSVRIGRQVRIARTEIERVLANPQPPKAA